MDTTLFIGLAVIGLLIEYIKATLGMGYGTALVPILLIMGFAPLIIVPVVLASQLISGVAASYTHHTLSNVNFNRDGRDIRIALFLAGFGIVGASLAAVIAIQIPEWVLRAYIGAVVISMGIMLMWARKRSFNFSWLRMGIIGMVASINKGMTGGGYGPLVTGGQILSGTKPKASVAITALAESITCTGAILVFIFLGSGLDVTLLAPLLVGSMIAMPLSGHTVKRVKEGSLMSGIGVITIVIGIITIYGLR